jgi:RNA polymerase sigma-70 factor (ECF subfamily)
MTELTTTIYLGLSDEALAVRIARHDERALDEFYRRVRAAAQAVAFAVLHDAALAEDAVQEALLAAWLSAWRFRPDRGAARSWFLTIVHRRAVDLVRARGPATVMVPDAPDRSCEDRIAAVTDREPVRHALRALPRDMRAPVALAFYADFTQAETAVRLAQPIGTVKSRTFRALARLRKALDPPGWEPIAGSIANAGCKQGQEGVDGCSSSEGARP